MAKAQGAGSVATATGGVDSKATIKGDNSSATCDRRRQQQRDRAAW
jgi:hypothetical protein